MLSSWTTSYHRARFAVDLLLNFNTRFAQSEKVSVRRALTTLPRLHVVAAVATRVLSVLTRSIIILVREAPRHHPAVDRIRHCSLFSSNMMMCEFPMNSLLGQLDERNIASGGRYPVCDLLVGLEN